jgi:alpha-tubulin suppressor-like RCC1 family protein
MLRLGMGARTALERRACRAHAAACSLTSDSAGLWQTTRRGGHRALQARSAPKAAVLAPGTTSGAGGELWSWGHSDDGIIREPKQLFLDSLVTQVSCGLFHAAAVTVDGDLFTWGRGEGGRLGNQLEEMDRNRGGIMPLFCPEPQHPVDIAAACPPAHELDPFVVASSAGGLHTLALTRDGQLFAFGFGRWGQLGTGVDGLNGTNTPVLNERLPPCKSISAGGSHSGAISVKGALMTWGRSDNGRCFSLSPPPPVYVMGRAPHDMGTSDDGESLCSLRHTHASLSVLSDTHTHHSLFSHTHTRITDWGTVTVLATIPESPGTSPPLSFPPHSSRSQN